MLTIRVEGGEMTIPKTLVTKIEKTDLTVANIENAEKTNKQKLADSDKKRKEIQAAEASAKKSEAAAQPAEEKKELRIVIDFKGALPNYVFQTYDPVLHRVNVAGLAAAWRALLGATDEDGPADSMGSISMVSDSSMPSPSSSPARARLTS